MLKPRCRKCDNFSWFSAPQELIKLKDVNPITVKYTQCIQTRDLFSKWFRNSSIRTLCVTKLLCRSISRSMQKTTLNMAIFALKCFIWLWENILSFLKFETRGLKKYKTIPSIMHIHSSCRIVNRTHMKNKAYSAIFHHALSLAAENI